MKKAELGSAVRQTLVTEDLAGGDCLEPALALLWADAKRPASFENHCCLPPLES